MSLLWKVATEQSDEDWWDSHPDNPRNDPDYFDHTPYSDRLRHHLKSKGRSVDDICTCEHIEHTQRSSVNEGMHPMYSAVSEGNYHHPWIGTVCDDCATGHMSDTGIEKSAARDPLHWAQKWAYEYPMSPVSHPEVNSLIRNFPPVESPHNPVHAVHAMYSKMMKNVALHHAQEWFKAGDSDEGDDHETTHHLTQNLLDAHNGTSEIEHLL